MTWNIGCIQTEKKMNNDDKLSWKSNLKRGRHKHYYIFDNSSETKDSGRYL